MDSGLRKLSIFAKLSRYKKTTASEIHKQLIDEGMYVSIRTIQRDLLELESKFPLFPVRCDDTKPIGWYIDKDANITIPHFDLTTSITFALADKHLMPLLPSPMRERLEPFVKTAKQFLHSESQNPISNWPQKVAVHTNGFPLFSPKLTEETINTIYGAVLRENCLRVMYRSLTSGTEGEYLFHPHGIIVRGERSYLVGCYDGYHDLRQLSLSRVIAAEELNTKAELEPEFSLSTFIDRGEMGVIRNEVKLEIKLWITPVLATILQETPLSEDQLIVPKDEDYIVTASVDNSDELRHWILSMCNHITVMSPSSIRNEIKDTLLSSLSYYQD